MATIQDLLTTALGHHRGNRPAEAEALYRQILQADPDQADALHMLGVLALGAGNGPQAVELIERAVAARPSTPAYQNLSVAYQAVGQTAQAARALQRGLAVAPDNPDMMVNLGNLCQGLGRLEDAVALYRQAITLQPDPGGTYNNLGVALVTLGRTSEAIAAYESAIERNPDDAGALCNLASALRTSGRPTEALVLFRRALALNPNVPDVHYNLANLFATAGRRGDALVHYREAARLLPNTLYSQRELLYNLLFGCHFAESERIHDRLRHCLRHHLDGERDWRRLADVIYLSLFCPLDDPDLAALFDRLGRLLPEEPGARERVRVTAPARSDGRLRIGYMTPNFGNHPVGHVSRGLYGQHDRSRFEVFAFSLEDRAHETDRFNREIRESVDHFQEIGHLGDADAAAAIRAHGIHILIDLNGCMTPKRIGILAHRAAPIQVYWLGHAGGVGLPSIDYLIADPVVVPDAERSRYRESVVRLPDCYHVTDRAPIAPEVKTRSAYGLADDAFVFCAFNNPQKIDRPGFDLWMDILRRVPGSQLWLSANDDSALVPNLRQAAADAGIAPDRLVFATRVGDKAEHLARHALADLFLDTFTLNASTTALDALWGGLPLLTMRGDRFPSRIAASMLSAVGLTELIVETRERYVAEAVALANDPARLQGLRERLWRNRDTFPLFDTARFTRHMERAFETMWARHAAGATPAGFDVPRLEGGTAAGAGDAPRRPGPYGVPASGLDLGSARRILVIKLDEIGDFILATPFLRELRRNAPKADIALVVSPVAANLAETCPYVDRVVTARIDAGRVTFDAGDPRVQAAFLGDFQSGRFDLAVVPRFDFDRYNAGPLAQASKAPRVVGYAEAVTELKAKRNAGFDRQFYTHTLTRPAANHEVEQNLALIEFLGGTVETDPVETWTRREDRQEAAHLLAGLGNVVAVCPGSSYPAKMFPLPRLADICRRLGRDLDLTFAVLGGEPERGMGQWLVDNLPGRTVSLCGRITLRQSVEVIRRCRGVLSMCSAPGHIAATVGTPVAVFTCHPQGGDPSHFHAPERFRPWTSPDKVLIIQPDSFLWPCRGSCEAPESHCIGNVQDAAVTERIAAFLHRFPPA